MGGGEGGRGAGGDESFSKISFSPSQSGRWSYLPERIRRRCGHQHHHHQHHPSTQSQAPSPPPVLVNCVKQIFVTSPYSVWEAAPVTLPPSDGEVWVVSGPG